MKELVKYSERLMQQASEEELIERARENPRWFEPLYNKYYEQIFIFLYKRHFDKELTADLCSSVFYKALLNIKRFEHKGLPFSSWLYRIALNESNSIFRKKKTQRTILLNEEHASSIQEELSTTEDQKENLEWLKKALKTLKSEEINMLELRFFNSFSFREIAEVLAISENNAKVRCYRILDKIRLKMDLK